MFGDIDFSPAKNGKRFGYMWHFNPREDSAEGRVGVPIGMIGDGRSPVALLIGATHGDEYIGPSLLTSIFHSISHTRVKGTIVVCPSSNITAVSHSARFAPEDGLNMNRIYPGSVSGKLSERICYGIADKLISKANLVLDIHSGGRSLEYIPGALARLCGEKRVDESNIELARAFGAAVTYVSFPAKTHAAHVSYIANKCGIPSIASEIGGSELVDSYAFEEGRSRIFNALIKFGVLRGRASMGDTSFLRITHSILASTNGFFVPSVNLNQSVELGDDLGQILDVTDLGTAPTRIFAKEKGLTVSRRRVTPTRIGDCLFQLASPIDLRELGLS